MKKILFLAVFLTVGMLQLNAQNDFRFGFQVSPTFSWLAVNADNQINTNGSNVGLRLSMNGEYYFRENYAFIGGLGFAFNQGGTLKHDIGGNFWPNSSLSNVEANNSDNALPDGVNLKYKLQYVEIPFGLKMRTNEFGYLRYFAELPVFTLGFNTQALGDISSAQNLDTQGEDIREDVNLLNLAWNIGGGAEFSLNTSTTLLAGVYYGQGFLDITDNAAVKNTGEAEDGNATTRAITIRIGVMF